MSSTIIDGYVFAVSRGVIPLESRRATRFVTSTARDAGVQVTPQTGIPFTLELTKYIQSTNGQADVDYHLAQIGRAVFLESNGIRYWQSPYSLLFVVLGVEIVESLAIPRACGHAGGVSFDFAPAWKIVSRWNLQSVRR